MKTPISVFSAAFVPASLSSFSFAADENYMRDKCRNSASKHLHVVLHAAEGCPADGSKAGRHTYPDCDR